MTTMSLDIAAIDGIVAPDYIDYWLAERKRGVFSWRKEPLSLLYLKIAWDLLTNHQFMLQSYEPQINLYETPQQATQAP